MQAIPNPPGLHVLLAMGGEPLEVLRGQKIVQKNRTITSLRNQPIVLPNTQARGLITYSPEISEFDYGHFVDLQCDVGAAIRLAKTGTIEPQLGDYQYVPDLQQVRQDLENHYQHLQHPVDLGFDTETRGLDPLAKAKPDCPPGYIISLQVAHLPGRAQVVYFESLQQFTQWLTTGTNRQDLQWLLTTNKIKLKGANGKYDLNWIYQHTGIECTNYVFDTTLVGSLLDENRSNGLDVHTKIYAPALGGYSDEFDRTTDKNRMDLVPPTKLLPYAAADADAVLQVAAVMREQLLQDPALTRFYVHLLHPAARAFEVVERTGILVDQQAMAELRSDLNTEILQLIAKAKGILGGRVIAKHGDPEKLGGLNLTKPSMLCDFMFSPMGLNLTPRLMTAGGPEGKGEKKPATSMEHLMMFEDVPEAQEFVRLMKDYGSATKTLSTYVMNTEGTKGFMTFLRSDGRFHPSYWFFVGNKDEDEGGAVTGRLSCRDPAFQTVPKLTKWAKRIRRCYPAPPGYVVVEMDFVQGELMVIACLANEPKMIQAFLENKDMHVLTGSSIAGMTYEQVLALKHTEPVKYEHIRYQAKPANFGLIYGQFEEGFKRFAELNYELKMSLERAKEIRNGFFELYEGLVKYHKEIKAFAHRHGHVRSPLGRIRHLPLINSKNNVIRQHAERQAVNSPTQATLSDMLLLTIALEHQQGLFKHAPCFAAVHDAKYSYVLEDQVTTVVPQMVEIMEHLPFEKFNWKPQLAFKADVKVGLNMADLKEWVQ
jgi:DNA polymerase I-like protein with 3'-5' exonuclease and polymerase domains